MTKDDFLHVLSDAIQQHEGWTVGEDAYENLNPGNLDFAKQANATENGRWAKFPTFYDGKQAQLNDIGAKLDAGIDTLTALLEIYAPPTENNTPAYITAVVNFFASRNMPISASESIKEFIATYKAPVILIAVNGLWQPTDWAAIQSSISQCAAYMPAYAFSCRYSNVDLSKDITTIEQSVPLGKYSGITGLATSYAIQSYVQGQTLCVMIYDGTIMQGEDNPVGGCEYQGVKLAPVSAVSSVMYNGPAFNESMARILFHELIHELFSLTEQTDELHQYLIAHGGYAADLAVDLEAVFAGNQLNTPAAVSNLEAEKNNL